MNQQVAKPNIVELSEERPQNSAVTAVEQSRAMQEATASILAAKRFPRDEVLAEKKIMNACLRPGLAEKATYEYKRGGSPVTGPSIRLAEALKQYWGNIDSGWRELDRVGNKSTIQAFAWDKETNTRATRDFTVMQVRDKWVEMKVEGKTVKRKMQEPLTDERDIYENNANNAARRMRACILELIPGDIIEGAVNQCAHTLASKEPNTPETRAAMLKVFLENYKVTKEMIEKYIGRSMDSIVPMQIVKLRSIYNSLQDEMSVPGDWFDVAPPVEEPKKEPTPEPVKTAEAENKELEGPKPPEKKDLEQFKVEQSAKGQKPMEAKIANAQAALDSTKKK